MRVTVIGAGSWGTALAILIARNGHDVTLYGRDVEHIESIGSIRENLQFLPGFPMPENITAISDHHLLQECDLWFVAIPAPGVRSELAHIRQARPDIVMASKGLEPGSAKTMEEVTADVLPEARFSVISGPNLAVEIVRGIPTAALVGSHHDDLAEKARLATMCRTYRVYTTRDVIGVELSGALKNVLAIGAGMSDGLGFGDNTKGALLARGLGEMARLGLAMGADLETFLGVAGVGDLFATAVSQLSRNYRVGKLIGSGTSLSDALDQVGQVAEGVNTAEATMKISRERQVPMPVFAAIDDVLRGRMSPHDGVALLMERMPKPQN